MCSSPGRAETPEGATTAFPNSDEKREEPVGPATGFPSLADQDFPGGGHERSIRSRPGGEMSNARVRGTVARHLDEEEQA